MIAAPVEALLVNTGYFRLVGSHNERMPLSLAYLSAYLEDAGIHHAVYNAEATGAATYWSWEKLFERFELLRLAVRGESPVFYEVAEIVRSFRAPAVVLGCGDPLLASVGLGNPYAAEQQARVLREAGVEYLAFFGPYATLDAEKWLERGAFDCVLVGAPGANIADVVRRRPRGAVRLTPMPLDRMPNLDRLHPPEQKQDVVLASLGCAWRCSFCLSPRIEPSVRRFPVELVADDVVRRPATRLYFGDMVFSPARQPLRALGETLERRGARRDFICENRPDAIDDERCEVMRRMGVIANKIGVESASDAQLARMNKRSTVARAEQAVACLRRHDIKVILYIMLGGPGASEGRIRETYEWTRAQDPDWVVVSTWSDAGVGAQDEHFAYDAHFSPDCLRRWDVDPQWMARFLRLRKDPSVSKLGDVIG